ncbi:hypothetical protein [Corynebacterium mastitidis]|uniref:hypothetical protein n=1 Tax=Corynebacterium mastitidis TaxID=161890 RepID=UPI00036DE6E5|nr:hypothetical protein [Corynebacterium mastitidis]
MNSKNAFIQALRSGNIDELTTMALLHRLSEVIAKAINATDDAYDLISTAIKGDDTNENLPHAQRLIHSSTATLVSIAKELRHLAPEHGTILTLIEEYAADTEHATKILNEEINEGNRHTEEIEEAQSLLQRWEKEITNHIDAIQAEGEE